LFTSLFPDDPCPPSLLPSDWSPNNYEISATWSKLLS
jgi:hypothetical protein